MRYNLLCNSLEGNYSKGSHPIYKFLSIQLGFQPASRLKAGNLPHLLAKFLYNIPFQRAEQKKNHNSSTSINDFFEQQQRIPRRSTPANLSRRRQAIDPEEESFRARTLVFLEDQNNDDDFLGVSCAGSSNTTFHRAREFRTKSVL